ncbi:MAG: 16S rRNA (cytosine(1402)-N(4))-methyltransferase RsmH [Alphaproteobacteria bacterium]
MSGVSSHIPVLRDEVLHYLAPRPDGIYVDGTFGRGGYSREILARKPRHLYAFDRDAAAIAAGEDLAQQHPNLTLIHGCFSAMATLLAERNVHAIDGIALDLGVSSPQLDTPERGFSFRADGPLDMRMDQNTPRCAADLVNSSGEKELADIIFLFGDERYARRIARAIVAARAVAPITRTLQLADIVRKIVPRSKDGIDPATRTFQALRIAVNDELGELQSGLAAAEQLLRAQGRLVVVSFHALEDRIVKDFLRARSGKPGQASRHQPANDSVPAHFVALTRRPVAPDQTIIDANPRARSARLRAAERTTAGAAS